MDLKLFFTLNQIIHLTSNEKHKIFNKSHYDCTWYYAIRNAFRTGSLS